MYRITHKNGQILELFRVGFSLDIPNDAEDIADSEANKIKGESPHCFDFSAGIVSLNAIRKAQDEQSRADRKANKQMLEELESIDSKSVRSLREFILKKFAGDPDLPSFLVAHDEAAKTKRAKLK